MRNFLAIFLFLLAVSLHALSDSALLHRAKSNINKSSKTAIFNAYNDYKNLYLRAIIKENKALKIKALKGIIESGNKLHIDVSLYKDELRNSVKTRYKKPKYHQKRLKQKRSKKLRLTTTNKLKRIYWSQGRLILRFRHRLKNKNVNYFKLYNAKRNRYKYVFDITPAMLTRSQRLTKKGIQSIKIAQYKPSTIRMVIQNDSVVRIRFTLRNNELVVHMNNKKRSANINHIYKNIHQKKKRKYSSIGRKVVVIDPGHGGKDNGATGYKGYKEKHVVLSIANYLKYYLQQRGYKVYMTRNRDVFIKLRNRTKYANRKKADLFISIHANAVAKGKTKAQGIETYFLSPTRSARSEQVAAMENKSDIDDMNYYGKRSFLMFMNNHKIIASNKLAIDIQQSILSNMRKYYRGVKDNGVREGPFWVLVGAQMPAVLIEVGFITHPKEARRLIDKRYQKRFAKGIADGIERYFVKNR